MRTQDNPLNQQTGLTTMRRAGFCLQDATKKHQ